MGTGKINNVQIQSTTLNLHKTTGTFFRDSHGNEVDLLIREKGLITPVEIKSSATFSVDFMKGLDRFRTSGAERATAGVVLYNGEQQYSVRGVSVLNPLHVRDIWKTLTGTNTNKIKL